MAGTRRPLFALAVAVALVGLTAAAAPGGPAGRVVMPAPGGDAVLQPYEPQPAVTPAKRHAGERLSVALLAVLVAVGGAAVLACRRIRRTGSAPALAVSLPITLRLRGPPRLQTT